MMSWDILFFFNSALLGVGLAMDAFSVSIANGLAEPGMRRFKRFVIAGTFAFFQFFMPMVGWFCVREAAERFQLFEKAVPWIALLLLLYIGGKMLIEGIRDVKNGPEAAEGVRLTGSALLLQGIATSIDALSVGFAINGYGAIQAFVCGVIIAVVTYVICVFGLHIGRLAGNKLSGKAGILGGCILIFIGIEIFIRGVV